jgi:hypothetical protein
MAKSHNERDEETDAVWDAAAGQIKEAFGILVEGVAQDDADKSQDRFARAIEDIRKARDLALEVLGRKQAKAKSR